MARRLIDSSLSRSKKFNSGIPPGPANHFARLLYIHLISHADRWGRGEGDPFDVKTMCIPHYTETDKEIEEAMIMLHRVDLITWYEYNDNLIYQIVDWDEHQNFNEHNRKGRSKYYPAPSKNQLEQFETVPFSWEKFCVTFKLNLSKVTKSKVSESKEKDFAQNLEDFKKQLKGGKDEHGNKLTQAAMRNIRNKIEGIKSLIGDDDSE